LPIFIDTIKPNDSRLPVDAQVGGKMMGDGSHPGHSNVSPGLLGVRPNDRAFDRHDSTGPLGGDSLLNPGLDPSDETGVPSSEILGAVIKAEPRIGPPRRRPTSWPSALFEHGHL
jgi:hypothetical protein